MQGMRINHHRLIAVVKFTIKTVFIRFIGTHARIAMTHIKSETAYKAAMDRIEELLGVSTSRVSDYLNGRCEPTLKVAREISRKLNIDGCGYRPRSINPCRSFADFISL